MENHPKLVLQKRKRITSTCTMFEYSEIHSVERITSTFTMFKDRIFNCSEKAASGLKDGVIDIDAPDVNNELAAVEYVQDIYSFYHALEEEEEKGRIVDYEINTNMRSVLIDWLIDVHGKYELMPETLYLTINLIDRFLSLQVVRRKELQLLGISAMLIASKYEEEYRAPQVIDFVSDDTYCREEILAMEKSILEQLDWCITVPTPYMFLARYIKASAPYGCDIELEKLVLYLAELALVYYPILELNRPSMLAASAVYAARQMLEKTPCWTETLEYYTGYLEHDLMEYAEWLMNLKDWAQESELKALYTKYCVSRNAQDALLCSLGDVPVSCS